jgi:hypothetical protein
MDRVSSMLSLVKVVENGGFAATARQLNVSPSVVTTQIKSLEDRLGVRLLNHSTRSVSLTEAGRAYAFLCSPGSCPRNIRSTRCIPSGTTCPLRCAALSI